VDYEFRTTIVETIHSEEEIKKMGIWLNEICERKPKRFVLQGFKNQGKFVDKKFKGMKDTSQDFLEKLKDVAQNYFEEVLIRG